MSTLVMPVVAGPGTGLEKMVHLCCDCSPQFGLCGTPVSEYCDEKNVECRVCEDLSNHACPLCGRTD